MFQNILKWTFKIVVDGVEKELNLHLDGDTPLQAIEQVAVQMIAHCSKVKEMLAAQQPQQAIVHDQEAPIEDHAISQDQKPAE